MHGTRHVLVMACYVYVLATKNKGGRCVTYVGWMLDLDRRLAEQMVEARRQIHPRQGLDAALCAEKHRTRRKAMAREYALKQDQAFRARLRSPKGRFWQT